MSKSSRSTSFGLTRPKALWKNIVCSMPATSLAPWLDHLNKHEIQKIQQEDNT